MSRKDESGFTLVELLVVIAIMAVLISILVPALTQAKYQAMRTQCLANAKAQHLAQHLYATDNEGKFAPHPGPGPGNVRAPGQGKDDCIYGLFKDSVYMENPQILLCPILSSRLSFFVGTGWDDSPLTSFRKLEMINEISNDYANWNYEQDPDYDPSIDYNYNTGSGKYSYVSIMYNWFANYQSLGDVRPTFKFVYDGMPVNTTPWPRNLREAREDAAMITHTITVQPGYMFDYSHKGAGFSDTILDFEDYSETADTPVGYGDGHAEMVPRPDVEARAIIGSAIYFY